MIRKHRPTAANTFAITLASGSDVDMRDVSAVSLVLRDPNGEEDTLPADIVGSATQSELQVSHDCDPDSGEAQTAGVHVLRAVMTTPSGPIKTKTVLEFRIVEDWEQAD